MFLPLLEFIESGRNIDALVARSDLWVKIVAAFDFIKMEVTLLNLIVFVVSLIMFRIIFYYFRSIYSSWLSQHIIHTTRNNLSNSYFRSNIGLFDKISSGRILNVVTTESARLGTFFSSFFGIAANFIIITGYIIILFMISYQMTLLCIFLLAISAGVVTFHIRGTRSISKKVTTKNEDYSFLLIERLAAFRMLKQTVTVERELAMLEKTSLEIAKNNYWLFKLKTRIDLIMEPIVVITGILIFFVAVEFYRLPLSNIGIFMLILLRLLPLAKELLKSRQGFLATSGSMDIIKEGFKEADSEIETWEGTKEFENIKDGIEYKNLKFTYPLGKEPVLSGVNLTFKAGEMTALVGPSGSGKSTIIDILSHLRIPAEGCIEFDGVKSSNYSLGSIRRSMAIVSQDAVVLNDTVRANLRFASPDATDEEILSALKKARSDMFVNALPKGMDTVLGERGLNISGGQKQRLSLARALLRNSKILVLDEPTSALDSETEKYINEAIENLRKNNDLTIIVIAHRLSTIEKSDQIILLDEGKVVGNGIHDELITANSWYSEICRLQLMRSDKDSDRNDG